MSNWSNVPAGKNKYDRLTRGGVTKYWSPGLFGFGGSYQTAATLNAQRQKEGKSPIDFSKIGVPKSTPTPKNPEPQLGSTNAQGKFWTGPKYGYQSWQTATAKRLLPYEALGSEPPKKASTTQPASTTPAPEPQQPEAQRRSQPPASTTPPAPAPKPQGQTGDRTKDLTTWATTPRNREMINKVGTPQQKAILSAAEKGTAMPAPRPISKDIEDINKIRTDLRSRHGGKGVNESYDAYDLVLEYLLSQGHVETLEEANYVMLEMDAKMIGDIVDIFYKYK